MLFFLFSFSVTVTVPHYVLLLSKRLENLQIPGDIFFTTVKLHLDFQMNAYCPFELRPFSACFCTMLWLVQLLCSNESDNWLLESADEDKLFVLNDFPNSLFLSVVEPTAPHPAPQLPHYQNSYSQPYMVHLQICARRLLIIDGFHCSWHTQPQRFPLNALIFTPDPKDWIMVVRMRLLACHVNQLDCFFYGCLATICSWISTCTWVA